MKPIYLILLLFLRCDLKIINKSELRILGGKDASVEEFPYVVRLEIITHNGTTAHRVHYCTGTAITSTWTLSAAHCIDGYNSDIPFYQTQVGKKNFTVYGVISYGSLKTSAQNIHSSSKILRYISHPGYRAFQFSDGGVQDMHNDVGLLQSEPIQIARYGSISYIDYSTLIGEEALAAGFGDIDEADPHSDTLSLLKPLQIIKVMVNHCDGELMYPVVCIVGLCGEITSICEGDSGGPLLHSSGLVGVNSLGSSVNCIKFLARGKSVGSITPISPYVEWIKEIISRD